MLEDENIELMISDDENDDAVDSKGYFATQSECAFANKYFEFVEVGETDIV